MGDFSIEMAAERITDSRTREYFKEVYLSYSHGTYRSAVVMLWTVVVCDVLFKLDQLFQAYADATAGQILTELADRQKTNPHSPEWESSLIESVYRRTELLDVAEFKSLQSLQSDRHLCAHPILTPAFTLATVNRETARAHIRNALEAVLTKPPFMSKKVFNSFMEDLESLGQQQPSESTLDRYISEKYLKYLRPIALKSLFRSLWRVTFKATDQRAEQNRWLNTKALSTVYKSDQQSFATWIGEDPAYFSDVGYAGNQVDCFADFLRKHPSVFAMLTDAAKTPLQDYANKNLDHFACCWFTSVQVGPHVEQVKTRIENCENLSVETFQVLATSLESHDCYPSVLDCGILLYGMSDRFDVADERFVGVLRPILQKLNLQQLTNLLRVIENNDQTYRRRDAFSDHHEIKDAVNAIFPQFDFSPYPHFKHSVGM